MVRNLDAKSLHHNTYGSRGLGKDNRPDEIFKAQLDAQTRRMFNEFVIEAKADNHYGGNDTVNVGDNVRINKRRPYSDYYKYGLIK